MLHDTGIYNCQGLHHSIISSSHWGLHYLVWLFWICWKLKKHSTDLSKFPINVYTSVKMIILEDKNLCKEDTVLHLDRDSWKISAYVKNIFFHLCLVTEQYIPKQSFQVLISKSFSANMQTLKEIQIATVMLPLFWMYCNRSWLVQTLGYNYISEWAVESGNFN